MDIDRQSFISPNFSFREHHVDTVIIHSTHMSAVPALSRLCDPAAEVSCHYLIDLHGVVYQLVDEKNIAWHAGLSFWNGRTSLNKYSIGIELVDRLEDGKAIEKFFDVQIESLICLLRDLVKKYQISNNNILAHSDVAPDRKDDPGEFFPWKQLAEQNIGMFFHGKLSEDNEIVIKVGDSNSQVLDMQNLLSKLGYKISCDGEWGSETSNVVIAFKRHFDQRGIATHFDKASFQILRYLSEWCS